MRIPALTLLVLTLLPASAWPLDGMQHPANGQPTCEVPAAYGTPAYGYPAAMSHADLTFGGPYPAAGELLPPERYMLAGTQRSTLPGGGALPAWINSVSDFCLQYYGRFGQLPAQLTPEVIASLRGVSVDQLPSADLPLLFNAFTGGSPLLNAESFSAGDLYVRPLTDNELRYFAQVDPDLGMAWLDGLWRDPETGSVGRVQLLTPVLYVRAYGAQGVIYENLAFHLSEPDFSVAAGPAVKAAPAYAPLPSVTGFEGSDCISDSG